MNESHGELPEMEAHLEFPASRKIVVGPGCVVNLRGWAFSAKGAIKNLYVKVDGRPTYVRNHSDIRHDVFGSKFPSNDPQGNSLLSQFSVLVDFPPITEDKVVTVELAAELKSGRSVQANLGDLTLVAGYRTSPISVNWRGTENRVAIGMATYEPDPDLLQKQMQSIVEQDHENWVCLISDDSVTEQGKRVVRKAAALDDRFLLVPTRYRKGFYLNFEQVLAHLPADADFVALCDQDDEWYSDKLRVLIDAMKPGVQLAYSDCRIVKNGAVVSDTYWVARKNQFTDLTTLMMANTITGAACLFRASLLEKILPFPEPLADPYHDHWIALVARCLGSIAYVDRPLYAYNQHGGNVIGHTNQRYGGTTAAFAHLVRNIGNRGNLREAGRRVLSEASVTSGHLPQKALFALSLLRRVPPLEAADMTALRRLSYLDNGLRPILRQKLFAAVGRRSTLNVEGALLWGAIGSHLRKRYYSRRRRQLVASAAANQGNTPLAVAVDAPVMVKDLGGVGWIFDSIAPLTLDVDVQEPKRVNLLLATIDFRYIFGGYLGMFNFALRLRSEGFNVRLILLEPTEFDLAAWQKKILDYPGVMNLFDEVEVVYRYDRREPLPVNPDDRFVATNGWGSHVAHQAEKMLGREKFLFMIQEYEPYFMPMNSVSALFQQSYTFPQFSLFSTELLRDFFRDNRIGPFLRDENAEHTVFSNAIQRFSPTLEQIDRREKRVLFYARPEAHAARNLFELGIKALSIVAEREKFDPADWSFYGMGSIGGVSTVRLSKECTIQLLSKTGLAAYTDTLPRHDVGLSLMLTPHPSLVPLEMAAAGMWTVTNTFANKSADALQSISTNLIAAEPTLDSIVENLEMAMGKVGDYDSRLSGAKVNWPTDWSSAFPPETMAKISKFLSS